MSFHTYAFTGFMRSQFEGTEGWGSPDGNGTVDGSFVLDYYEIMDINQWICFLILICMAVFYRILFLATLSLKEWMAR
jgi:hypothetical protein